MDAPQIYSAKEGCMNRLIYLLALVGLVAGSGAAFGLNNGRYTITSSLSGLVMDVAAKSTADGAKIQQYTAQGSTNQQFDVTSLGDGSYSIRPVHSGKSLDVYQKNANDGAELRQWSYSGASNQRWHIDDIGGGVSAITSVFSGKAVEVWQGSTAAGAEIRLSTYSGGARQKWSFRVVAGAPPLANLTVWLAGDSTVATGGAMCPIGWGRDFSTYFDSRVTVQNLAAGGRSVRTWLYDVQSTKGTDGECRLNNDANGTPILQARWQTMLNGMKRGDYLFIQFGINDGDSACPRHVGGNAFMAAYTMMAQAARARGAIPVFITPVSAISCSGNTARPTRGFLTETNSVGAAIGVPVIDLHARSIGLYNSRGFCPIPGGGDITASTGGAVGLFFCNDHTHFDAGGAVSIGGLVAAALRDQNIPLAQYLK
jgi:lysophospholipase L1-like esterase